jgi:hypothetical protein
VVGHGHWVRSAVHSGRREIRLTGAGALANDRDIVRVASEARDVCLDPLQSSTLVAEKVVAFVACLAQLLGGQRPCLSQSVAVAVRCAQQA